MLCLRPQLARRTQSSSCWLLTVEGCLDEARRSWLFQLKEEAAACFSSSQKWAPCISPELGSRGGQTPGTELEGAVAPL